MNKKRVLCISFLLLLLLPTILFVLLRGKISVENNENREYAQFPKVSLENYKGFSAGFEDWYNDRLPFKQQFVEMNASVNKELKLNSTWLDYVSLTTIIVGKDDWLFYSATGNESSMMDYMCNNLYTEEELQEIAARYQKAYDQYKELGTELVLYVATNKEQVYSEYMPDNIVPVGTYSRTDQLVDYLNANTDVKALYSKESLIEQKCEYPLFYKYDTHWNYLGGFIGSQVISDYILGESEKLSDHKIVALDTKPIRDLADVYGFSPKYEEKNDWGIADYKEDVNVSEIRPFPEKKGADDRYCIAESDADNDLTVVMINDSFVSSMYRYIEKSFSKTMFSFNTQYAKDYVLENGADYLIIELVERSYNRVENQVQELYLD